MHEIDKASKETTVSRCFGQAAEQSRLSHASFAPRDFLIKERWHLQHATFAALLHAICETCKKQSTPISLSLCSPPLIQ